MAIYKQNMFFEMARGIKAFLRLEAGLTRDEVPYSQLPEFTEEQMDRVRWQLARKDEQIARLQKELNGGMPRTGEQLNPHIGRLNPANIVWIFGTARVGSTWLASMMDEPKGHTVWHEPLVGNLFGSFYYVRSAHRQGKHAILGEKPKGLRSELIRTFILQAAGAKFPNIRERGYLVIKEPNGSIGAPLMVEALPESRVIFLVRDPRDVVSSNLSGKAEGGWFREAYNKGRRKGSPPPELPNDIARTKATRYRDYIGKSKEAYEAHRGPKVLVRYEELRADTLATMKRIYSELDIEVDEEELGRAVEKHSWENVPEEEKGEGKFHRKATPGGWREDLTAEQVGIVEEITAPLLKEFYPG